MNMREENDLLDRIQFLPTPDEFKAYIRAHHGLHVLYEDCTKDADGHYICPDCKDHEQRHWSIAHPITYGDCKQEIGIVERWTKEGICKGRWVFITKTQCACTGPAHGQHPAYGVYR